MSKAVNAFITLLPSVKDTDTLRERAEQLKRQIQDHTDNIGTWSKLFSYANKAAEKQFGSVGYTTSISVLKLTPEESQALKDKAATRTATRNDDRIMLDGHLYKHVVEAFKHANTFAELCVCAIFATGRRPTEIAKTACFQVAGPSEVVFSGQLKTREKKREPNKIPVLGMPATELVSVVEKLRTLKDYKDSTVAAAAASSNNRINDIIKTIFSHARTVHGQKAVVTAETIRGAYAWVAYRLYCDNSIPETTYAARILGHGSSADEPDLLTSVAHYQRCTVYHWPGAPIPEFFLLPDEIAARQRGKPPQTPGWPAEQKENK